MRYPIIISALPFDEFGLSNLVAELKAFDADLDVVELRSHRKLGEQAIELNRFNPGNTREIQDDSFEVTSRFHEFSHLLNCLLSIKIPCQIELDFSALMRNAWLHY